MKKIKLIISIYILILLSLHLSAQQKSDVMVFGHVVSQKTKEHIPYSYIIVKGTNYGTIADGSGHYKLTNIPAGKMIILAQAIGYKSMEKELVIAKGESIELFFELESDVLNLNQIVVTGTRSEHFIKDVPVRTEVITSEEIANKNAVNLFQALEGTPGIRVENQCQYCNFTMIRMQGLGAEHTQVLINGQPMYTGLAGVYGLQQLSTVDVDKIEVVKGAGSALYGSGAVAGAINVVTKEPSYVPETSLDIQFGSHGTQKYDINSSMRNEKGNIGLIIFAQRFSEGVVDETGAGLTSEEVRNPDGISDRVETNLTNAGFGIYFNDLFFKNDKLIIRGKSVFEKREGGTMIDDYFKNPFTDGTENITTDRYEASLMYNKKIGSKSAFDFTMAYVNHNRNATNDSYLMDYLATHHDTVPDLRNMRPYLAKENSLTSMLSFNTKLGNHSLITGIQIFYDQLEESGMYVVVDENSSYLGQSYRSTAQKSAFEFGAFVQDEWEITKKITIVPGIRMDYHKSGEEYNTDQQVFETDYFPKTTFSQTAFNPRIAIKYSITNRITIRFNTGTGFRAPYGFSEDLHLCSGSPRVWKSSDLNPEKSLSYNLSADYYGKRVKISTNIFRTDLKDKIGFTDADESISALGYDYQWKNIDDAFVQGIELSVITNIAKDFDFGIDFTINQGKYKHVREDWVGTEYENISKYIPRFPMTTGNLKLEYTPKSWLFSIMGSYQGTMYIDYYNSEIDPTIGDQSKIKKTAPYILFNAKILKAFKQFKIYGGVNNILDYVQDERHLDDAAFMYAPVYGRTFYIGFAVNIQH
jgi:outer membrane receptor for ferrienterochelin and colicins